MNSTADKRRVVVVTGGSDGIGAAAARMLASRGDEVVIVAGSPPGIPGSTNAVRVHRIGDVISQKAPAYAAPV